MLHGCTHSIVLRWKTLETAEVALLAVILTCKPLINTSVLQASEQAARWHWRLAGLPRSHPGIALAESPHAQTNYARAYFVSNRETIIRILPFCCMTLLLPVHASCWWGR